MRSTFGSSTLVRLLGDWTPAPAEPSGPDVAERLSLWVNAFDAIRLQAAHQAIAAVRAPAPAHAGGPRAQSLAQDVERVRSVLVRAIAQEPAPVVETARTPADLRRLARAAAHPDEVSADASYAPWRQRHLELQRQMELMIPPLREHLRQALSHGPVRMRRLAALDAVLEQVLGPREQKLLAGIAQRMEARFAQLLAEHLRAVQESGEDDPPAAWRGSGGWLQRFAAEWRQLLAAELDLRLQAATGLVEALANELNEQQ